MCCQQPTLVAGRADKGTGIGGKTGLFTQLAAPIAGATVAGIKPKHMAGNAVKARASGGHMVSIIRHKAGDRRACRRGAANESRRFQREYKAFDRLPGQASPRQMPAQ